MSDPVIINCNFNMAFAHKKKIRVDVTNKMIDILANLLYCNRLIITSTCYN